MAHQDITTLLKKIFYKSDLSVEATKANRGTGADCIRKERCQFKVRLFAASCGVPIPKPRDPPPPGSPCVNSTHNSGSVRRFLYGVLAFHNKLHGCLSLQDSLINVTKSAQARKVFLFRKSRANFES